jgi:hypothetical protein
LQAALDNGGASLSTAEVHGMVCGYLCGGGKKGDPDPAKAGPQGLLAVVFPDPADQAETGAKLAGLLAALLQVSEEHLQGPECSFTPILPDDDETLAVRAAALSDWCQGFLYAIGPGLKDWTAASHTLQEFVSDIRDISRLDPVGDGESDETAYTELVEYVRAGVMLAYVERPRVNTAISGIRSGKPLSISKPPKVH